MEGERHDGGRCDCEKARAAWKIGKHEHVGCPERLLEDIETVKLIDLWSKWKMFGLRYPGAYGEQPALYIDLLEAMEAEVRTVKVRDGA